jgi:hypothetical protein
LAGRWEGGGEQVRMGAVCKCLAGSSRWNTCQGYIWTTTGGKGPSRSQECVGVCASTSTSGGWPGKAGWRQGRTARTMKHGWRLLILNSCLADQSTLPKAIQQQQAATTPFSTGSPTPRLPCQSVSHLHAAAAIRLPRSTAVYGGVCAARFCDVDSTSLCGHLESCLLHLTQLKPATCVCVTAASISEEPPTRMMSAATLCTTSSSTANSCRRQPTAAESVHGCRRHTRCTVRVAAAGVAQATQVCVHT